MTLALDHLVVVARTLDEGAAWCRETFGVEPGPGGKHPLMGTHNRLLAIGSDAFPRAYLEIIAIDPEAPPPGRARWFGMDAPHVGTPQLRHWVARTGDLDATLARWAAAGLDGGRPVEAMRAHLRWRIALRGDGALLHGGAVPTLIEWGDAHPADAMAAPGVRLLSLGLRGVPASLAAALPPGVAPLADTGPALEANFDAPAGRVTLRSA